MRAVRAGDEEAVTELISSEPELINFKNFVSLTRARLLTFC
jgi:hypothetical protein